MGQRDNLSYYEQCLHDGLEFQDFAVATVYREWGLPIVTYASKATQCAVGESVTGVEMKLDRKWESSGNLYIETHERSRAEYGWSLGGILRRDNSWLYLIGNQAGFWLFAKRHLLVAYQQTNSSSQRRYEQVETIPPGESKPTSRGFLLPLRRAETLAIRSWRKS